jgi:3-polyprenyl-4-hydroxybenzoate decarboxylase
MAKGKIKKTYNGEMNDYKDSEVIWNVPHYSKLKYVVAVDKDVARAMIRDELTDFKWTGARLVHIQQ